MYPLWGFHSRMVQKKMVYNIFLKLINKFSADKKIDKKLTKTPKQKASETPSRKLREREKTKKTNNSDSEDIHTTQITPTQSPSKRKARLETENNNWNDLMSEIFVPYGTSFQKGFRMIIVDYTDADYFERYPEILQSIEIICFISVPFTFSAPESIREFRFSSSLILPSCPLSFYFFIAENSYSRLFSVANNLTQELKGNHLLYVFNF